MSDLMHPHARGNWSSKFGFLMAAVGSAVGLGNIWRFPYIVGQYGGALFLIVYILLVAILGFPLVMLELSVGRHKQASVVSGAFVRGGKRGNWSFIGWMTMLTCFLIVSFYSVIGGWIIKYFSGYVIGGGFVGSGNYSDVFSSFITNKWQPVVFNVLFLGICLIVLALGVKKGIEKVSKVLMPALFVMLVFVAIVSFTMEGALEGIKYIFVPSFKNLDSAAGVLEMLKAAMGQAFFSLSLGMGITVTYGSYLKKNSNIAKDSIMVCGFDTLCALLASLAIIPAVFSGDPSLLRQGPGLLFVSLPTVFATLGAFGKVVAAVFFLLVLFAAATSAISILEVLICSVIEKFKLKRLKSTLIVGGAVLVVSTLVSLSQSGIFKIDLLGLFDMFTTTIMLPATAFLICLFASVIWKTPSAVAELRYDLSPKKWTKWWEVSVTYVSPALIALIFVLGFVGLNLSSLLL